MRQRALNLKQTTLQRTRLFFDGGPIRRGLYSLTLGLRRHHVGRIASAMAFDLFLAAIPMFAFAGWLSAKILQARPDALSSTRLFADLTPAQVHELVSRNFERFSAGAVAPFALLGMLWLASGAYHTLMSVFEGMVGARKRSWWTKRLLSLACVVVTIVAFSGTAFLAVVLAGGPMAMLAAVNAGDLGLDDPMERTLTALLILTAVCVGMAAFFRVAIHRPGVRRRVWPGAFTTVAIGGLSSFLLAYYVKEIARLALYYGSLAAVAVMLTWIWVWCFAMLVGAELNAQLEGGDRTPPSRLIT